MCLQSNAGVAGYNMRTKNRLDHNVEEKTILGAVMFIYVFLMTAKSLREAVITL